VGHGRSAAERQAGRRLTVHCRGDRRAGAHRRAGRRGRGRRRPRGPGDRATWTPAGKDGFGTARSLGSKVWYTLNDGALTEVYFPRLDTPSVRDLQLIVTDGTTFADLESQATTQRTLLTDERSLSYQQIDTAKSGRYRITKTYATDPARSALLVDVDFQSLDGRPYQVYALYDPSLSAAGDDTGASQGDALVAHDAATASALVARPAFRDTSSGFLGVNDGWTDLRDDFRMDFHFGSAADGNVVQTARTALTGLSGGRRLTLSLGFGAGPATDGALSTASRSLATGFAADRPERAPPAGRGDLLGHPADLVARPVPAPRLVDPGRPTGRAARRGRLPLRAPLRGLAVLVDAVSRGISRWSVTLRGSRR
jgi:hypothetical protein